MKLMNPPNRMKEPRERPHAVVIGSGFGGLAAAIRLGARGYRVTVLEKLDAPGGRAYVHRQDGFTFDAGPTIVTAPFLLEELWSMCGRKFADEIDLRAITPYYQLRFDDGSIINYNGDPEHMRREVARISPGDEDGFEKFMEASKATFDIGFTELAHVPFGKFTDMVKVGPALLRLKAYYTVFQQAARFVKDERLRVMLSFHPLLVGGNPFATTSVYSMIAYLERRWGVHFVMGGTGRLITGMVDLIKGQGGELRCHSEVRRITVANGAATGVVLASGESIAADIVVSNADAAFTYRTLLGDHKRKRWTDRKIDRSTYSMSLFVWYFGTNRKYDDVEHHTILLGPRYRGLLEDIFKNKVLAKDFSLYLHRPTATDPSLAPDGCDAFYVLSPVPHLDSGTDWNTAAEPYRLAVEAFLEKTILPGLKGAVVSTRVMTPLNFRDDLLSHKGAAFGMEPVLTQSAWFRPHNKSEEVENLFIVGAGAHPGAGLPGVLSSARVLDKVVPDVSAFA